MCVCVCVCVSAAVRVCLGHTGDEVEALLVLQARFDLAGEQV